MGDNYVPTMMQYEYSIYKPAELWEKLDYSLQGMNGSDLLRETGRLRRAVAELGIPTDISDEYLMMTEAIGYTDKLDLLKFKRDTLLDIMAGSTDYTREIVEKINAQSNYLANLNVTTTGISLSKTVRED
jgi:PP-loop superfamily ATP-utilizing enzyme